MSKLNNHDSVNNSAAVEPENSAVVSQTASQGPQEHDRLAVFIEHPDKANYLSKAKKIR